MHVFRAKVGDMTDTRPPTKSEVRWGIFLAATLALYVVAVILIPLIRFMNGL